MRSTSRPTSWPSRSAGMGASTGCGSASGPPSRRMMGPPIVRAAPRCGLLPVLRSACAVGQVGARTAATVAADAVLAAARRRARIAGHHDLSWADDLLAAAALPARGTVRLMECTTMARRWSTAPRGPSACWPTSSPTARAPAARSLTRRPPVPPRRPPARPRRRRVPRPGRGVRGRSLPRDPARQTAGVLAPLGCPRRLIMFPTRTQQRRSTRACSGSACAPIGRTSVSGGPWLDVGGQQVHLIEAPLPEGHGQHFAVLVADLGMPRWRSARLRRDGSDPVPVGSGRGVRPARPVGQPGRMDQSAA